MRQLKMAIFSHKRRRTHRYFYVDKQRTMDGVADMAETKAMLTIPADWCGLMQLCTAMIPGARWKEQGEWQSSGPWIASRTLRIPADGLLGHRKNFQNPRMALTCGIWSFGSLEIRYLL